MKSVFYLLLILISFSSIDTHAQLTVIDTINFRPSYLEDSIQLIRKRNDHFIDAQGNFWIGFSDLGARKLTDTLWTEFTTANSGIASNYVLDVSQSANNNMWFGTNNGVSVFDGTNWTNYNRTNSGIISDTITVIEHHNNTHWIGTRKGLSKFDGTTFTNYNTTNSGLPADSIMCLATDQTGNVWVGTKTGLAYFDGAQWIVYDSLHNNLDANTIYDIAIDGKGVVWVTDGIRGVHYFSNSVFVNYFANLYYDACAIPQVSIYYIDKGSDGAIYFKFASNFFCRVTVDDTVLISVSPQINFNNSPTKPIFSADKLYVFYEPVNSFGFVIHPNDYKFFVYDFKQPLFNQSGTPKPFSHFSYGIFSDLSIRSSQADLNVNQVIARILNKGDMHWDPYSQQNNYVVPYCSNKQTVFASSIWLGGLDQSGLLHTAAQTYRQQGADDFFNGPLDTLTAQSDSTTRENYDKLWKVDQWIINQFRLNFLQGNVTNGTYTVPEVILKWPASGNGNFSRSLAPFVDYDHDGNYNAMHGDYPFIDGDQMIWWIFNDQGLHTETLGTPFGFELHGKAYGYGCPDLTGIDTVFNYTTFYQWKIINRSAETYHDMYVGLWCDFDLGNATDDYVGCDVGNASFFAYNGDSIDDDPWGYGIPPIQNVTVLKGPLANVNDGMDNNHNGVIDEQDEPIDLSNFLYYYNSPGSAIQNPQFAQHYYNYLRSIWTDNTHMTYGSNGLHGSINCNYQFPGTTDPEFPNQDWTMAIAGIPEGDVRGVGSSGPFTIAPGETRTIDFAYITTRDPNVQISIATNALYTSYIRNWFKNGAVHPCPHDSFTYVPPATDTSSAIIYPNPSFDFVLINIPQGKTAQQILVYDMDGRLCISKTRDGNKLDIRHLAVGVYVFKLATYEGNYISRFVKLER